MGTVAIIRTSDRGTFKRCRRGWALGSPLAQNRGAVEIPSYFWIGTGGHFALEDYHSLNQYKHPAEAFKAYRVACQKTRKYKMPDDWQEQEELAIGLLDYYLTWLEQRQPYKTYHVDGVPQVEVHCQLKLPIPESVLKLTPYDSVVYDFTLDRIVDIEAELWVLDYKFYKSFMTHHLDYDPQMEAYIWAAQTIYDRPIVGAIVQQHKKHLPSIPRILASGKLSTDEKQGTTHRMYREALTKQYGDMSDAPANNVRFLNLLATKEAEDRDDFIRRDRVRKTPEQIANTGAKILLEVEDMLNPDLPHYPNMTKDCSWDCGFKDICLMMDRDDDWESLLNDTTAVRNEERDEWRKHLTN